MDTPTATKPLKSLRPPAVGGRQRHGTSSSTDSNRLMWVAVFGGVLVLLSVIPLGYLIWKATSRKAATAAPDNVASPFIPTPGPAGGSVAGEPVPVGPQLTTDYSQVPDYLAKLLTDAGIGSEFSWEPGPQTAGWGAELPATVAADYGPVQALSQRIPGVHLISEQIPSTTCWVPAEPQPICLNVSSKQALQLSGPPAPPLWAGESGLSLSRGICPHSMRRAYLRMFQKTAGEERQCWISVHEFDDRLLGVIPDAENAEFISPNRLLVSFCGDRTPSRPLGYMRPRDGEVLLFDIPSGRSSPKYPVRAGGMIVLAPSRAFLVLIEPDEETSQALRAAQQDADYVSASRSTDITVVDARSWKLLAKATYEGIATGHNATLSGDERRLALHGKDRVAIIDLATGEATHVGRIPQLAEAAMRPPVWLKRDLLALGNEYLLDVRTGNFLGRFAQEAPAQQRGRPPRTRSIAFQAAPVPQWLGGEYYRRSAQLGFSELPLEAYDKLREALADPQQNYFASRRVLLELATSLTGEDLETVRACLVEILQRKARLSVVAEGDARELPKVTVSYAEQADGAAQFKDIHTSAVNQQGLSATQLKSLRMLRVQVGMEFTVPDGRLVHKTRREGRDAPQRYEESVPGQTQFRLASLLSAASALDLELPIGVFRDASRPHVPQLLPLKEREAPQGGDVSELQVSVVTPDSSWLRQQHGLPVRHALLAIEDLRQDLAPAGFSRRSSAPFLQFVQRDHHVQLLLRDLTGKGHLLNPTTGKREELIDLSGLTHFTIHPSHQSFVAYRSAPAEERSLVFGTFDGSALHHVQLAPKTVVTSIAVSGNGAKLVLGRGAMGGIEVFDYEAARGANRLSDVQPVAQIAEAERYFNLSVSHDGQCIGAGSGYNQLAVWDAFQGELIYQHRLRRGETGIKSFVVSADGKGLFVALGNEIVQFDLAAEPVAERKRIADPNAYTLAWWPQRKSVVANRTKMAAALWNFESGDSEVFRTTDPGNRATVASTWSLDGRLLAVAAGNHLTVYQLDP